MNHKSTQYLLCVVATLMSLSFVKTYFKNKVIIVGYEIGRLKNQEALFLKKRGLLTMELAKLTTKSQLEKFINNK